MFGLGPWELIIIGLLLFVLFGAKRIPEIGKGLGGAVREFKTVKKEMSGKSKGSEDGEDAKAENKDGSVMESLERKVAGKVLGQVPGVRRVMGVKDKVDKVKKFVS